MNRRVFLSVLSVLSGRLLAAPLAADAQPGAQAYRIGILNPTTAPSATTLDAFRKRLADLGYVDGQTLRFESRNADGQSERLPALAADLVRLRVDVLVTFGSQATKAAKDATTTVPIMFLGVASPVESGIVASLAQPGGNVTGATDQGGDLSGKMLQLIKDIAPKGSRIGVVGDFRSPGSMRIQQDIDQMARQLSLTLVRRGVRIPDDIDAAFATLSRDRIRALLVNPTPALVQRSDLVAKLALENRWPSFAYTRGMAEAGLLMSYGASWPDLAQRAAEYVARILKGANPADLPIVQPTRFDLVINLKTAKALRLTIPPSLLQRADQVIE